MPARVAALAASPSSAVQARRRLRRSLAASTVEGIAAELVMSCVSGTVITAWALYLGCDTLTLGVLGALPFLAQVLQLPGAWLTSRCGARATALVTVGLSRQMFWPLVLLPTAAVSPEAKRAILVAVAATHHGLGVLCNNAWVTWMGDLVPPRLRGRYFGRRTQICTVANALSTLAAGSVLDWGREMSLTPRALSGTALFACFAGAVSTWLMSLKHSVEGPPPGRFDLRTALRPLWDARALRFLRFQLASQGAAGLAAPFLGVYLLRDLRLGFALTSAHGAGIAVARMFSSSAWGRQVDRVGSRRVIVVCSTGIAASPMLWIWCAPDRLWPLAIDSALTGVLISGLGVASFALPLALSPREERPFYCAIFAMAGGAAYAAACAVGAAIADDGPGVASWSGCSMTGLQSVFLLSCAMRCLSAVAAWHVPDTRREAV